MILQRRRVSVSSMKYASYEYTEILQTHRFINTIIVYFVYNTIIDMHSAMYTAYVAYTISIDYYS